MDDIKLLCNIFKIPIDDNIIDHQEAYNILISVKISDNISFRKISHTLHIILHEPLFNKS